MNDKLLLVFLLCGLCVETWAQEPSRQFHFVNQNLTWTEAQRFCRETYTDLATVRSTTDMEKLNRTELYTGDAWIGLFYSAVAFHNFLFWLSDTGDLCPTTYPDGEWQENPCSSELCFVCYRAIGYSGKQFFLVTTHRNYTDAQLYCRENYTDLALIESEAENNEVTSLLTASTCDFTWIKQGNSPWKWSDGSQVQFSYWKTNPWNSDTSMCGAKDQKHDWSPVSCSQRLPFFCYKTVPCYTEARKYSVVKVSFRSDLDMSDPNNYRLLTQKMEERLNQPGLKVTWKTPPKKMTEKKNDVISCPHNLT